MCPKFCTVCQTVNATKPPAGKVEHEYATEPYSLIFSDCFGPVQEESSQGYKYGIHFTDAYSRKCAIYFLRTKDEALDRFMDYLAEIRADGYDIDQLVLRTDNANEYVKGKFARFCYDNGIRQQSTAPYVHTNAAVAERLWRSIDNDSCICLY